MRSAERKLNTRKTRRANGVCDLSYRSAFDRALSPKFVNIRGSILVAWSAHQAAELRKQYRTRRPSAAEENTTNHLHVEFANGPNLRDNVIANFYLAQAIALAWEARLRALRVPSRRVHVLNEYEMLFRGRSSRPASERIIATIRVWARTPESEALLDKFYEPWRAAPTSVFWPERRKKWYELDHVLRFVALPGNHALKTSVIAHDYPPGARHVVMSI